MSKDPISLIRDALPPRLVPSVKSAPEFIKTLSNRIQTARVADPDFCWNASAFNTLLTDDYAIVSQVVQLAPLLPVLLDRCRPAVVRDSEWAFALIVTLTRWLPSQQTATVVNKAAVWWATAARDPTASAEVLVISLQAARELLAMNRSLHAHLLHELPTLLKLAQKPFVQATALELLADLCYDSREAQLLVESHQHQLLQPLQNPAKRATGARYRAPPNEQQPEMSTKPMPRSPLRKNYVTESDKSKLDSLNLTASLRLLQRLAYIVPPEAREGSAYVSEPADELYIAARSWDGRSSFATAVEHVSSLYMHKRSTTYDEATTSTLAALDEAIKPLTPSSVSSTSKIQPASQSSVNSFVVQSALRALANTLFANPPAQKLVYERKGLGVVQQVLDYISSNERLLSSQALRMLVACADVVGNLLFGDPTMQDSTAAAKAVASLLRLLPSLPLSEGAAVIKNVSIGTYLSFKTRALTLGGSVLSTIRDWLQSNTKKKPSASTSIANPTSTTAATAIDAASAFSLVLISTLSNAIKSDQVAEWVEAAFASLDVFADARPLHEPALAVSSALCLGCQEQLNQTQRQPLEPKIALLIPDRPGSAADAIRSGTAACPPSGGSTLAPTSALSLSSSIGIDVAQVSPPSLALSATSSDPSSSYAALPLDHRESVIRHLVLVGVHETAARGFVSRLRSTVEREPVQYWCDRFFEKRESALAETWYYQLQNFSANLQDIDSRASFVKAVSIAFDIEETFAQRLLPFVERVFFWRLGLAHWLKLLAAARLPEHARMARAPSPFRQTALSEQTNEHGCRLIDPHTVGPLGQSEKVPAGLWDYVDEADLEQFASERQAQLAPAEGSRLWFHGCSQRSSYSINTVGIQPQSYGAHDFGLAPAFYVGSRLDLAIEWAYNRSDSRDDYVAVYVFTLPQVPSVDLERHVFETPDQQWGDFVLASRSLTDAELTARFASPAAQEELAGQHDEMDFIQGPAVGTNRKRRNNEPAKQLSDGNDASLEISVVAAASGGCT
ncbi:hypothetical protein CAOG_01625 [Capsaspora owczarzaki ATCC 30864]|uniref:Uncharacterized protein n=1 Tax=Capsaspora owczarzaki (strain ATCC 30864) TaxID=595528 RepID=A0A0D2VJV9_CAPO3|nr:hypothetical protein CAOG_01625 [Capsaspora owczarzaki ATCC 30864]KJE90292.1 hypothetical protein CAOG_001625 [Capsaspora owczarzaki ATCC 30864]|eukprot:XP_004364493.1 hypothetical protein CAOG_01625 [Capsaspora owczarzaki ATCC 30864]